MSNLPLCSDSDLYINPYFGLKNINKFEIDKREMHFNKICMIKIENAGLLTSTMGQDGYYTYLRGLIQRSKTEIQVDNMKVYSYGCYALGFDTLVIACGSGISDEEFIGNMKYLEAFSDNKRIIDEGKTSLLVFRMVAILNQKHMIGCAYNQLHLHEDKQVKFIISDGNKKLDESTENELKVLEMINYAIYNDKVIPYYQGINNNKINKIDRYEALMRIEDKDGEIHLPFEFLNIAKKYRLYLELTKRMIKKVLDEYANRGYAVSINISSLDINSTDMRKTIVEQVSRCENPSNVVFELLEDECFKNIDGLKSFIDEVRAYGVQIGIDDFGSGYSNLLELIKIKPDYIKIDGEITKSVIHNEASQMIMDTVSSLAVKLDIDIVAEYVENKEIQEEVQKRGIQYSQGYYFAKPQPIEEIDN